MEEHHLLSAKDIKKKFHEWFRNPVSADPLIPVVKELQKKFHEWFRDPVSPEPPIPVGNNLQKKFYEWFSDPVSPDPPFPAEANHSIGDSAPADLSFLTNTYDSRDKTQRSRGFTGLWHSGR